MDLRTFEKHNSANTSGTFSPPENPMGGNPFTSEEMKARELTRTFLGREGWCYVSVFSRSFSTS